VHNVTNIPRIVRTTTSFMAYLDTSKAQIPKKGHRCTMAGLWDAESSSQQSKVWIICNVTCIHCFAVLMAASLSFSRLQQQQADATDHSINWPNSHVHAHAHKCAHKLSTCARTHTTVTGLAAALHTQLVATVAGSAWTQTSGPLFQILQH
jgi:hypothetical protein